MKTEKEIQELYDQWRDIIVSCRDFGDPVSMELIRQTEMMMSLFDWILS